MEVPRLGVESELQMPAYTTATPTLDLSHVCDLHHSSQQCQILNPMSEAKDQTQNLMVPSQSHLCCTMTGTPLLGLFLIYVGMSAPRKLYMFIFPLATLLFSYKLFFVSKNPFLEFPSWLSGNESD